MLVQPDQDVVRNDPSLPGLALLLDDEALCEEMRAYVPGLDRVESVYVRYKPGENAVVAFRFYAQGESHWAYAKAHRLEDSAKLAKASKRPSVASELGPDRIVLDDWSTCVSFFPNDAKLKSLHRVGNADHLQRLMRKLVPDRNDLWFEQPRLLRYKPERRYVARIGKSVLKLHAEAAFARAAYGRRATWSRDAFQTAHVIGRSWRHRALLYEWVDGDVLADALRTDVFDLREMLPIGAALATLHARRPDGLWVQTNRDTADAILASAVAVGTTCPNLDKRARQLAHRISTHIEPPEQLRLIHGDFYAKQILLSIGAPTFLDFDRLSLGDPAVDFGTFLAHLERDYLRNKLDSTRIENAGSKLFDGYLTQGTLPDEKRLAVHTAAAILQLAPHPFRFREPAWPERTAALLDAAERHLDDGEPRAATKYASAATSVVVTDPHNAASDVALPTLLYAIDPHVAGERLATLVRRNSDAVENASLVHIDVVRHRPGKRALVKYSLDVNRSNGESEAIAVYGKIRAKGLDRATFSLNAALWRDGFGRFDSDGIVVPEPIGIWSEAEMWVQREVSGVEASVTLEGTKGVTNARRIGNALAKLHRTGPVPARRHALADEIEMLHDRLGRLAAGHPHLETRLNRILTACEKLAATLRRACPKPLHRDFYAGNVLVSDTQIALLDLDLYALGDPALDIGNFIGHLIEQGLREYQDAAVFHEQIEAFEQASVLGELEIERASINAYTTFTLVRHLYISTQIPSRQMSTESLLDYCEQRLLGAPLAQHSLDI